MKSIPSTLSFHGMKLYVAVSRLKRIFSIGMMRANEKMFSTADSMFNMTDSPRYRL